MPRRPVVPAIRYPPALPVSQRKDDIAAVIRDHQVVVVAGETGSGKTTQLPKICLELGRGSAGLIGHTQPRRLAARTVAERIAEELGGEVGAVVGYQMRFTDRVGGDTRVKLMTDGILLAEIQRDRLLRRYDTIIIDEAHERSLNIDFILGYLHRILPRRRDLKVVITSATIDPERFAGHFGDAPIVEVSGRTFPVEVRYRPLAADDADRDQVQAILDAVDELCAQGPGDILVFLSGEREIRDTAEALRTQARRDTEVLPLFARLSTAEQHRVFQSPTAGRRIVLATNVAETSLTVPGIKYVVDPGTARISRYSLRTKVQRLPIEPISQASADQRKGRCGRTSDGICVRLYAEEDFARRPEFTDPEIIRTNLAAVILQMTALGLGKVADFPFLDPPDQRHVKDGVLLLEELGALDAAAEGQRRLTPVGRSLAQLPIDPRLARMVVEADRNGCLREVMVIAAALSIQDPRERPVDRRQAADEKHRRFSDPDSDFFSYLNLWEHLRQRRTERSSSQFRRMCREEFLHYLRVREWQDLYTQLKQAARAAGMSHSSAPENRQAISTSLLAGLLSHVGLHDPDRRDYLGARNARFSLSPGSALFRKPPRWLMAAELVETTRLWAHTAARIEPQWVEPLAQHLVRRSYSEPHWEKKRGAVMAYERVTLYGIPIVPARKVGYGLVDPALSRELFIRRALVEGDWDTRHRFFAENRARLAEVEDLEERTRRRDILVDDETLFDFYDSRLPDSVVSAGHFDSWWKRACRERPDLLDFSASVLIREGAAGASDTDYPDTWRQGALMLALAYRFEPGDEADGVTVHVPLPVLNRVSAAGFDWQVPGLRQELVTALIRSLPKSLRRNFVPAPDVAATVLAGLTPYDGPLTEAMSARLRQLTGVTVPSSAWQPERLPAHLRISFLVKDAAGRELVRGRDLDALRRMLQSTTQATLSRAATRVERAGLRDWSIDELPRTFEEHGGGHVVQGYPALVDEGDSVGVRVLASEAEQDAAMWRGTRRMLLLGLPSPSVSVAGHLDNRAKLALSANPHGSVRGLLDDCLDCAVDALMAAAGGPRWDPAGFAALRERIRAELHDETLRIVLEVEGTLSLAHAVSARLSAMDANPALAAAVGDLHAQLSGLVYPGFVADTGAQQLPHLLRYLRAIDQRLDDLPSAVGRDAERVEVVHALQAELEEARATARARELLPHQLTEIRWMIEELRVSLFAQRLGTVHPVSEQRVRRRLLSVRNV
ncbi:MAG: ATP-dependent RNA helicase HrpA [Actinomycetota bacterium]|nr:ATP-dependent RNA helicase HrpA [Actinomycetota bacterium]